MPLQAHNEPTPSLPISASCDFREFCAHAVDCGYMQTMDMAGAEAAYHKRLLHSRSGSYTPRVGSKLRAYCDDLQELTRILVNANISDGVRPGFVEEIRPLMVSLFRQVQMNGNVNEVFSEELATARRLGPIRPPRR